MGGGGGGGSTGFFGKTVLSSIRLRIRNFDIKLWRTEHREAEGGREKVKEEKKIKGKGEGEERKETGRENGERKEEDPLIHIQTINYTQLLGGWQ